MQRVIPTAVPRFFFRAGLWRARDGVRDLLFAHQLSLSMDRRLQIFEASESRNRACSRRIFCFQLSTLNFQLFNHQLSTRIVLTLIPCHALRNSTPGAPLPGKSTSPRPATDSPLTWTLPSSA